MGKWYLSKLFQEWGKRKKDSCGGGELMYDIVDTL
jgi:hypothetical protein